MDLSEAAPPRPGRDGKMIEALALALDISITMYDRDDRLIAASSQFQRFFNIPSELLVPGARLRDLLGAAYDAGARTLGSLDGQNRAVSKDDWIAERIATHWRERHESVERLADGRWVRLCKRRMPDGFLISTMSDVSEQYRRDSELVNTRQQAELAQHILDNLANPVMVKDSSLRYVIVNDAFCRIPGVSPRQVLGRSARDLVDAELATRFEAMERKVLETGVPYEAVEHLVRGDGSIMRTISRARRSGTTGNYYVTISLDDVTEYIRDDNDCSNAPTTSEALHKEGEDGRPERVLVLDRDQECGEARVADLKACGIDALMIGDALEAFAFLGAAKEMGAVINRAEISDELARDLADMTETGRHPILVQALEEWSRETSAKPVPDAELTAAPDLKPDASLHQEAVAADGLDPQSPQPPLTAEAVAREVARIQAASAATVSASDGTSRVRVLVAEDNSVNQIVFEQILEGIGVDFRIVCNGEEALAAWRACPPDMILMDISMPVMNGLQATTAIRDEERAGGQGRVPIIAVTAHAMSGDRERCMQAGMDDYLSKPVSPEKLEAIVGKWIESDRVVVLPGSMMQI